jgi:hypothetical protein
LVVVLAGCGGAAPEDTGGATTSTEDRSLQYAECVREHGVPDFEDPGPDGGTKIDGRQDPAKATAMMEAARECREFAPGGSPAGGDMSPADIESIHKYAQCMRDNGVPDFPDPDSEGRITVDGDSGLQLDSPEFKQADEKCASLKGNPGSGK